MKGWGSLAGLLRPVRGYMAFTVLLGAVLAFGGVLEATVLKDLSNTIAAKQGDQVLVKAAWLLGVIVLFSLLSLWVTMRTQTLSERLGQHLKQQMFDRYLNLAPEVYGTMSAGEGVAVIMTNPTTVASSVGQSIVDIVRNALAWIASSTYLLLVNPTLTLTALALSLAGFGGGYLIARLQRRAGNLMQTRSNVISGDYEQTIHGMYDIQQSGASRYFITRFVRNNDLLYRSEWLGALGNCLLWISNGLARHGMVLGVVAIGGYTVLGGNGTLGDVISYLPLVTYIAVPINTMNENFGKLQRALGAAAPIVRLSELPLEQETGSADLEASRVTLRVEQLNAQYDGRQVLTDASFEVAPGTFMGMVGPSGSGKSTVLRVLLGLARPVGGTILVNGRPLEEYRRAAIRRAFTYVPQRPVLFSGTIRENLMMGRPGASEVEMIQAASQAGIHQFILTLPRGYDTLIGEKGIRLSGGEAQRLALARAFLRESPVLLLDEPTSALDRENESRISDSVRSCWKAKTVMAVAHRLNTIRDYDQILVLKDGHVVECGTHTSLMRLNGTYAAMVSETSG